MIKKILLAVITSGLVLFFTSPSYAQTPVNLLKDVCSQSGTDNAAGCKDNKPDGDNPFYGPDGILTKVVNIVSIMVGLAAVISVIWAGMRMISAGDNPEEVGKAREYIQYAIMGLVLAALAQAMVRLVLYRVSV